MSTQGIKSKCNNFYFICAIFAFLVSFGTVVGFFTKIEHRITTIEVTLKHLSARKDLTYSNTEVDDNERLAELVKTENKGDS